MRTATGSLWRDRGLLYARITWTDGEGKRHSKRRRAMDETHARSLCRDVLGELRTQKYIRLQPKRAKRYIRNNLQIYCIQILDGAVCPIKIGTSCDISKRLKMILTHSPYEARLIGSWSGSVLDEKAVHQMFATSRMAREWFRPTPELLEYITEKTKAVA